MIALQSLQKVGRGLVSVLVNRVDFIARFKIGYVDSQAFPRLNPLSSKIIKRVHGGSLMSVTCFPKHIGDAPPVAMPDSQRLYLPEFQIETLPSLGLAGPADMVVKLV